LKNLKDPNKKGHKLLTFEMNKKELTNFCVEVEKIEEMFNQILVK